jgi:PAS domain-containing protein
VCVLADVYGPRPTWSGQVFGGDVMVQDLATRAINYEAAFRQFPGVAFLLSRDFRILDVSDDVQDLTGRGRCDLVGRNLFDAFPANPHAPQSTGPDNVWAALAEAARSGDRVVLRLNEYDVEDPGRPGVFEERFWSGIVTPIPGPDGRVAVLATWGYDITPAVSQVRAQAAAQG